MTQQYSLAIVDKCSAKSSAQLHRSLILLTTFVPIILTIDYGYKKEKTHHFR